MKKFLSFLILSLFFPLSIAAQPEWATAAPIEKAVVHGGFYITDDIDLNFGDDVDIQMRYDEAGDNRLEWTDGEGSPNLLGYLLDNGSAGKLAATLEVSAGTLDSIGGYLRAFGAATDDGGILILENADNEDSTVEQWIVDAEALTLAFSTEDTADLMLLDNAGGIALKSTIDLLDDQAIMFGDGDDFAVDYDSGHDALEIRATVGGTLLFDISPTGDAVLNGDFQVTGGDITSSSGAIAFGNENLSTTGSFSSSTLVVTTENDGARFGPAPTVAASGGGDNLIVVQATGNTGISIISNNASNTNLFFGDDAANNSGQILYQHSDNSMIFNTLATAALTIDSSQDATFAGDATVEGVLATEQLVVEQPLGHIFVASGVLAPAGNTYIKVRGEGNASDTVTEISAPTGGEGTIIILEQYNNAQVIDFTDNDGDLNLSGNYTLNDDSDKIALIYADAGWNELFASNNETP